MHHSNGPSRLSTSLQCDTPSVPFEVAAAPWDVRRWEPLLYALRGALKTFCHRFLRRDDKLAALVGRMLRDAAGGTAEGPIRLVDVGCAQGALTLRIAERLPRRVANRFQPIGIEISNHLAKLAHLALRGQGGHCIHGTGIDGLGDVERGSAHVIVLSGTLEHEIAPLALLRRCRERLALDGRIVVKVPNDACVGRRILGGRWHGYRWPDRVNHFTPQTLAAAARAAGLQVVRMNAFDRWPLSDSLYAVLGRDASVGLEAVEPTIAYRPRQAA
jgi:SAM-dependent methyltransferase